MQETKSSLNKAGIIAWCFYEWANSAFSSVITTYIFATYFTQAVATNSIKGTGQWSMAIALAGIIIALVSPIFGAIADHEGRRKPWLAVFTCLAVISAVLLWFGKPNSTHVHLVLSFVVLGTIGLEVAMTFYNALLYDIAPSNYMGRISGWAKGLGYIGGLTCLVLALFVFIQGKVNWFNLNNADSEHIRICGPFVGLWLGLFSLPLFFLTPDHPSTGIPLLTAIKKGLSTFIGTIRKLRDYKEIVKFLIAQMVYIDGINTLMAFGGIYAAGTFHMGFAEILELGITLNIAAGIGAIAFAWLDDLIGAKPTIMISLLLVIIFGTGILFIHDKTLFWLLTLAMAAFVGPIQAASRSLMARMVPEKLITEMFGLYAFSGKATSFLGPWILGLVTVHFASQRAGMSTIVFFLLAGLFLLIFVHPKYLVRNKTS